MLSRGRIAAVVACLTLCALPAVALAAIPSWTTYHHDGARSGIDPDSTSPVTPTEVWQSTDLDGSVWAEPLAYGSLVYAVTENDSVYALDPASGAVVWRTHLATPVNASQLCGGDITPTVGITSTPVIDPATGRIYVVADTERGGNAGTIAHDMYALDLSDGKVAVGPERVDPPNAPSGDSPAIQLQRTSLALDAGKVIIGYGGNDSDCDPTAYHGWLVAAPEGGTGPLQSYEVDSRSGDSQGAIWGSGNAPPVDSSGNIWFATGNGSSGSSFDFGDAVIEVDSNLNRVDYWAPTNWQELDKNDGDLGSSMPMVLPGGLIFQIGKTGVGYLLNAAHLGGVGAPKYSSKVCAGSWGGGIYYNGVIYVACSDGMHALTLDTANDTFARLAGWSVDPNAVAPPIFAGGLVWSTGATANSQNGILSALNPRTGAAAFSANLHGFEHFATPSAGGGLLFVANQNPSGSGGDQITAFRIANVAPGSGFSPLPVSIPPRPKISSLHVRVHHGRLRLRLTLSESARLTITVWKLVPRRFVHGCRPAFRRGSKCLVASARKLKRHRSGRAGRERFRLRMRSLPPGEYLVVVKASNAFGRATPRRAIVAVG